MDEGKMDENEWKYHGEGNKSLVVAHAQVSRGWSAGFLVPLGRLPLPVEFLCLTTLPLLPGSSVFPRSFP